MYKFKFYLRFMFLVGIVLLLIGCSQGEAPEGVIETGEVTQVNTNVATSTMNPIDMSQETLEIPFTAKLSSIRGEVLVKQAGMDQFGMAYNGDLLSPNSEIAIGLYAEAWLTISDGSLVYVGPNTLLKFDLGEFNSEGFQSRITLYLGKIGAILKGDSLMVLTRSGYATLSGSVMTSEITKTGVFTVDCFEGHCLQMNNAGGLELVGGESGSTPNVDEPPDPSPVAIFPGASNSSGQTLGFPDVWIIPYIEGPQPVPYPNVGTDSDKDGIMDKFDKCPSDSDQGFGLDALGCPIPLVQENGTNGDADRDQVMNNLDRCPNLGDLGNGVDDYGCPIRLPDSDGDGYPDDLDNCPNDDAAILALMGADDKGCVYAPSSRGETDDSPNPCADPFSLKVSECSENEIPKWSPSGCFSCNPPVNIGDFDSDGVPDDQDKCVAQGGYLWMEVDKFGCPISDTCGKMTCMWGILAATCECINPNYDDDGDGVPDSIDQCIEDYDISPTFFSIALGVSINEVGCPDVFVLWDTDRDGILDYYDSCPEEYGFVEYHGCLASPVDSDRDGVPDNIDRCPDEGDEGYGLDRYGCPNPPPDRDGDGVSDKYDACPSQGNEGHGVDSRGCPNPAPTSDRSGDRDGDGVPDNEDSCPSRGDEGNGVDRRGCPNPPPDRDDDEKCTDRAGNPIRCP